MAEAVRQAADMPLEAVARFAERVRWISWFAALGEPLLEAEIGDARAYLAELGFPDTAIAAATGWREAERIIRNPRWEKRWWAAEEAIRRDLFARATQRWRNDALLVALTRVTNEATAVVLGMASTAALRSGVSDQAIASVAAGAATQACYQAALALAAEAGEHHPFALKLRLFEAGRWPLGLLGSTFHLF